MITLEQPVRCFKFGTYATNAYLCVMSILDIVEGHLNELFGNEQTLSEERMSICRQCPIMKMKVYGAVCDSYTYLNTTTGEVSQVKKEGFQCGCGCRLEAKTRLPESSCPLGKW